MKTINETFSDEEYSKLKKMKDKFGFSWRLLIIQGVQRLYYAKKANLRSKK